MALRGSSSQSFLRSKELISFSEIHYDKEGNYIYDMKILKEALARDENGNFIRNKSNIANILNKYGIIYRMIFNTMNMSEYTYNEIQTALNHLSSFINDLGISGIIEFHAADKTQNSDHIHFWINTEDILIYKKIAQEMITMGYSNKEDVYIQKYEDNKKIKKQDYIDEKIYSSEKINSSYIQERYNLYKSYINENIKYIKELENKNSFTSNSNIDYELIIKNCTLPINNNLNNIFNNIKKLYQKIK